mgnify:CR=1 FL=1
MSDTCRPEPAEGYGEEKWYAIWRNESRELKNMITAYSTLEDAEKDFETWANWDRVRATKWEIVSFPRWEHHEFKTEKVNNEGGEEEEKMIIDFHDVWHDWRNYGALESVERTLDIKSLPPTRPSVADMKDSNKD